VNQLKITDKSIIKALEVHTIMASSGYLWFNGVVRIFSLSPNHYSVLSMKSIDTNLHGKYGESFSIMSGGGYTSPYWKAKNYIEFFAEDEELIVKTDVGVGVMHKVEKIPKPPSPPEKLYSLNLHSTKVDLSKLLGTKNFKRPRVNRKYVKISDVLPVKCPGNVKSSTLLQVLEIAWRVNKIGRIGCTGDVLYVLSHNSELNYEAFLNIL